MQRTLYPIVSAVLLSLACAAHAERVYDNSVNDLNVRFNPGLSEVADEIILGGTARLATNFSFEYYGISFSGNEQARVRFYLNDGPIINGDPNARAPMTEFFDSGIFDIVATARNVYQFDLQGLNITLPERFSWSVQFSGIEAGENAGVDIYNPPVVGGNFNDYWLRTGPTSWELRTNGTPIAFAARFDAVPEPSAWALALTGGLCGFFLLRRRSRS